MATVGPSPRTIARRRLDEVRRLVFKLETLADVAAFEASVCDGGLLGALDEDGREEVRRVYRRTKAAIASEFEAIEVMRATVGPRAA